MDSNDVMILRTSDIVKRNHDQQEELPERHGGLCKGICKRYLAQRPTSGDRYASGQSRCSTCDVFLTPEGIISNGKTRCKCCHIQVRTRPRNSSAKQNYFKQIQKNSSQQNNSNSNSQPEKISNDFENYEPAKKSTPIYKQTDDSIKTYYEFKDFLSNTMKLQANYQLVMLKELLEYGTLHKGEIAESLAYFNNEDSSDINSVKYFLDVPVYDVLTKHEIVKMDYDLNHVSHYSLNVKLTEFQKLQILEDLAEQLTNYNLENNIPENQFPYADNMGCIDWSFSANKKLLMGQKMVDSEKPLKQTKSMWIWSVTPANWEILKINNVWGSRIPKERIASVVKSGDQVAFYVIGTNSFKGICEFDEVWYDSPGKIWDDDIESTGELRYKSQIKIKPICYGDAKLSQLFEKMDLFEDKPTNIRNLILQGGSGYPSNNKKSLSESDFKIILEELQNNPESTDVSPDSTIILDSPLSSNQTNQKVSPDTVILIKNDPMGIRLSELKELKSEFIKKGDILSNDSLMDKFGVGNMGGIRFSRKNNLLVLCSTASDDYHDIIDEESGLITYSGEGREGDQEVTKGNSKIANSSDTQMLFFKEKSQEPGSKKRGALDNLYEFVGQVKYLKHYWKDESGKDGHSRKVLKFVLEVES